MNNNTFKASFELGKIDYNGTGKRYPVTVSIELREEGGNAVSVFDQSTGSYKETGEHTPRYIEFSAVGSIGRRCFGQCLDEIADYVKTDLFKKIYKFWKAYHLNGMNAGTPEQTAAVNALRKLTGETDYNKQKEFLQSLDLLTVNYTGKSTGRNYNGEPYTYGTGWIIREIPAGDLEEIAEIISNQNGEPIPEWIKA